MVSVSRMFGAAFFSEVLENSHLCYPRLDLGREKEGVNFILLSTKADSVSCTLLGAPNLSEAAYLVIFFCNSKEWEELLHQSDRDASYILCRIPLMVHEPRCQVAKTRILKAAYVIINAITYVFCINNGAAG